MKITCNKSDLLLGINIAMRAVPTKTTLPILESILLVADSQIRLIANDNEMGIETAVKGEVSEPGSIAIDARIFGEIVRKLPDNDISITADRSFNVKIICEGTQFDLIGRNAMEFPELPKTETQNSVTLSQFTLKELIRQTIFSISLNDTNALMRGELFEIEDNTLQITSLDSHRISIRKELLKSSYENAKVIVPGKALNEIGRILSSEKEDLVDIIFDGKFIKFSFGKTVVLSRLIEGEYFNVAQMISSDFETEINLKRTVFLDCIDRASTLTRENEKKPVILEITDRDMYLSITSSLGSMNEHLPITKQGKDLRIGFNPRFFIEALKAIDDEEISIYFVNAQAPCFIRDKEGRYIYVILPVNISR